MFSAERVTAIRTLFLSTLLPVYASVGDQTVAYQSCLRICTKDTCNPQTALIAFNKNQPLSEKLLLWRCEDQCRYDCMWQTVELFIQNNLAVPQFHGKWPFVRWFGIQEPASMIFSAMNGIAHMICFRIFLSKVSSTNQLFPLSFGFGIVAINVWVWSTIFHTRDFPFTEKMDYFSATAGVLYSLFYGFCRISYGLPYPNPVKGNLIRRIGFLVVVVFFVYHTSYLSFRHFDYGYNMLVNVTLGLMNGTIWVFYHWSTRGIFAHQWKGSVLVLYTSGLLILELVDFVPIWWTFDGHCLWHLGTVIFPWFWYSFMIDECNIFEEQRSMKLA